MSAPPQFDHAKADAVITKANATIRMLRQQTSDRKSKAKTMQKTWTGHYADQFFGTEIPRMSNQAAKLITELQGLITQLHKAAEDAQSASSAWINANSPKPSPGPAPTPPAPGH